MRGERLENGHADRDAHLDLLLDLRLGAVRDLGRVLAPELPEEWKPLIEKTSGTTTGPLVTQRGVELLAICNQRQVSDDFAAEVVFRAEDLGKQKNGENPNEEKYLADLRSKAQIDLR